MIIFNIYKSFFIVFIVLVSLSTIIVAQKSVPKKALTGSKTSQPKIQSQKKKFVAPKKTKVPEKKDFGASFKQAMAQAKENLAVIKQCFQEFKNMFGSVNYNEATKLVITKPQERSGKNIGFAFDFSYAGAGELGKGFEGVAFVPVIETIDPAVQQVFQGIFNTFLAQLINGKLVRKPFVIQPVLSAPPLVEFVLKLGILVENKRLQKISGRDFSKEFMLLVLRLAQTKGFSSADDIVKAIPAPLQPVLTKIVIKKKPLVAFLKEYWGNLEYVLKYDADKAETTEITAKQSSLFLKELVAILFRSAADFSSAKINFLKTPEGKKAYLQLKFDKEMGFVVETQSFKQLVPEYAIIKERTLLRVLNLLKRFQPYKKAREKIIEKGGPIINPLLNPMGFSIEMLLPSVDAFPDGGELTDEEFYSSLEGDALFGIEQDEAILQEQIASEEGGDVVYEVDSGPHPLDVLFNTFDEFSQADQNATLTDDLGNELEAKIMAADQQCYDMRANFDEKDLKDYRDALLQSPDWVVGKENLEVINQHLSIVEQELGAKGVSLDLPIDGDT